MRGASEEERAALPVHPAVFGARFPLVLIDRVQAQLHLLARLRVYDLEELVRRPGRRGASVGLPTSPSGAAPEGRLEGAPRQVLLAPHRRAAGAGFRREWWRPRPRSLGSANQREQPFHGASLPGRIAFALARRALPDLYFPERVLLDGMLRARSACAASACGGGPGRRASRRR